MKKIMMAVAVALTLASCQSEEKPQRSIKEVQVMDLEIGTVYWANNPELVPVKAKDTIVVEMFSSYDTLYINVAGYFIKKLPEDNFVDSSSWNYSKVLVLATR